eukprot:CAMPEP_0172473628 /NCGR_PEP_ID=MMETSP1065-20121228/68952_1 /TAXON_ID=265537 /ORGANISM="Amphiprora paludosa, Strain CCMP125" /LENGTH=1502 /DNA_ID=CAMNT_0013231803 /DNA_START=390 /DNA_END=4899 /DNA_ORIENTATION=-
MSPFLLKGVDPTTFNVVASLLAEVLMLCAAHALSLFFKYRLSLFLRRGNPVSVAGLGRLPSGLLEALEVGHDLQWIGPCLFLLLLFLFDYSTTIAFAGLGFTTVPQRGSSATVLNLQSTNTQFPYEVLGDAANDRTLPQLEVLLASSGNKALSNEELWAELQQQEDTISPFVAAADALARGESVFLESSSSSGVLERHLNDRTLPQLEVLLASSGNNAVSNQELWTELQQQEDTVSPFVAAADALARGESVFLESSTSGVPGVSPFGSENDNLFGSGATLLSSSHYDIPLVALNQTLPLECNVEQPWRAMTQIRGVDLDFTLESVVPQCSYTSLRASGLYLEEHERVERMEITSYVSATSSVALYLQGQPTPLYGHNQPFILPANGHPLARDRLNVRDGRSVFGLGGVQLDQGVDLPLGRTALASGPLLPDGRREYHVAAQVLTCPPDPSRHNDKSDDTTCLSIITLHCDVLNTDKNVVPGELQDASCTLEQVQVVWGRGFVVNRPLLAAVAGVYGRNAAWATLSRQKRTLALHAIPAARFTLSTVEMRDSIEYVKSTSIDWIFIFFMSIPVGLCLGTGLWYVYGQRWILPIPDTGWAMLVLGAETARMGKVVPPDGGHLVHLRATVKQQVSNGTEEEAPVSNIYAPPLMEYSFADEQHSSFNTQTTASTRIEEHEEAQLGLSFRMHSVPEEAGPESTPDERPSPEADEEASFHSADQSMRSDRSRAAITSPWLWRCWKATESKSLWGAMLFSVGLVTFGAIAVHTAQWEPEATAATRTTHGTVTSADLVTVDDNSNNNIEMTENIPFHCFADKFALGQAVNDYLQGSGDVVTVKERYGHAMKDWCVDYIQDLSFLFAAKQDFNEDIEDWNTSSVVDFSYLFANAESFQGNLSGWDVSRGVTFRSAFEGAAAFNGDISGWDMSSARDVAFMFRQAVSFEGDLSEWNLSSVESLSYMLSEARRFQSDISGWDVARVTDFSGLFAQSPNFFTLTRFNADLSAWDVSSGQNFSRAFEYARFFNSNLSHWDMSSATDCSRMFYSADSFESDLSHWDVSNVENFEYMFYSTNVFESDLSKWDVSSGTNFRSMFYDTNRDFATNFSEWDVSRATDMSDMFAFLNSFDSDLSSWNVSRVTNFDSMFFSCQNFNSDLSQWDTQSAISMRQMFQRAFSFTSDLSGWDVSNVQDFYATFDDARSFNSNLSSWDVGRATTMQAMFQDATSFNGDISNWDVSRVSTFHYMFSGASAFEGGLSSWDVSSGITFDFMFRDAEKFNSNLCSWQDQFLDDVTTINMLKNTDCVSEEVSELYMCVYCPPTPAPSSAPSFSPSLSSSPSLSMAPSDGELLHQTLDSSYWVIDGFFIDIENIGNSPIRLTRLGVDIRNAGFFYALYKAGTGNGYTSSSAYGEWTLLGSPVSSVADSEQDVDLPDTVVLSPGERYSFYLYNTGQIRGAAGSGAATWEPYSGDDHVMVMHNYAVGGFFGSAAQYGQYNANRIRVYYEIIRSNL